jgi:alpha-L-arabinofuranosidase
MNMPRRLAVLISFLAVSLVSLHAASVTVRVDEPGAAINPAMWGVFFEDINFGADGGLYAELVKNRGFEFPEPLMGWAKLSPSMAKGELTVRTDAPFTAGNPHYVRLQSEGTAPFGLSNEGFRGMGIRADEAYNLSVRVRRIAGAPKLTVRLYGSDGAVLASAELRDFTAAWEKYPATLRAKATDDKAWLAVLVEGAGTLDLDFVSLFPEHTWKDRPAGLRADMVQALADMHPGFLRFPGGCIVEGTDLARRYEWKKTLGPVEERPLLVNRWNYEFLHRPASDYYQSFGLGFFEYFQLCEDIGAQPLPILNCGMACQFNSGELCPLDQLDPYIQDALDLIEFANGPVTSTWGAKRAALGHPAPFHLHLLGVGNEQWGQEYIDRYAKFAAVLKAKHPEISLVAAAGPDPGDARFKLAWEKLRPLHADLVDEHSYARPEWFLDGAHRYDDYDRNGPKVFMGEYAAHSTKGTGARKPNNLDSALAEAAFMTGLERNADVVRMASYAPLFAHVDAWQWAPNLLWTDNLRTLRTPDYHVQSLFARNRGDRVLPVTLGQLAPDEANRVFASAVTEDASSAVIIKLVNATANDSACSVDLAGVREVKTGTLTVLRSDNLEAMNSFEQPDHVAPRETNFAPAGPKFDVTLPAYSFSVIRVGVAR